MVKSPSDLFWLTNFTGTLCDLLLCATCVNYLYSGMRGLPALIWDGSVLDAGSRIRS